MPEKLENANFHSLAFATLCMYCALLYVLSWMSKAIELAFQKIEKNGFNALLSVLSSNIW